MMVMRMMTTADGIPARLRGREGRGRLAARIRDEVRKQAAHIGRAASGARRRRRVGALEFVEAGIAAFTRKGIQRHDAMVGAPKAPR